VSIDPPVPAAAAGCGAVGLEIPLQGSGGSVLHFDDPIAPVGKNDWEALA
jgi:hypothetical protein